MDFVEAPIAIHELDSQPERVPAVMLAGGCGATVNRPVIPKETRSGIRSWPAGAQPGDLIVTRVGGETAVPAAGDVVEVAGGRVEGGRVWLGPSRSSFPRPRDPG
jgi:hypothetical protein